MKKALFLDRDGTLIIDKHYLEDPAGVELIPGVITGLQRARELGFLLFLFTNQSGIGRGYHTLADAEACNRRMLELLGLGDELFTDICIAPESSDQPVEFRKPSPRFIHDSMTMHALDPAQCWMVGDRESDIEAGLNAGIHAAAVCTGKYDQATWQEKFIPGMKLFSNFAEFAEWLAAG